MENQVKLVLCFWVGLSWAGAALAGPCLENMQAAVRQHVAKFAGGEADEVQVLNVSDGYWSAETEYAQIRVRAADGEDRLYEVVANGTTCDVMIIRKRKIPWYDGLMRSAKAAAPSNCGPNLDPNDEV